MRVVWAVLAFVSVAHAVVPDVAAAQDDGHRLAWRDEWNRAGTGTYLSASALTLGAILADVFYRPNAPWPGWEPSREDRIAGSFAENATIRRRLRIASRVLGYATALQAELVDPALVVWAGDRNRDVAQQMYALNGLSLAATAFVTSVLTPTIRRPRPAYQFCLADPEYDPTCGEADQVRSLVDGRLAIIFTSVALTCTHHANLPIYGGRSVQGLACAGASMLGVSSAFLAMLADRQHPSDVITAVALGVLSGFVLPSLVGYRSF